MNVQIYYLIIYNSYILVYEINLGRPINLHSGPEIFFSPVKRFSMDNFATNKNRITFFSVNTIFRGKKILFYKLVIFNLFRCFSVVFLCKTSL